MSEVKIIVTGGKTFENRKLIYKTLDSVLAAFPGFTLLNGKGKGCETHAGEWADLKDVKTIDMPIDWKNVHVEGADVREGPYGQFNAQAGMMRNRKMIPEGTHLVAFWDGTDTDLSTKIMVDMAKKAGLKVKVILLSGDELAEGQSATMEAPAAAPEAPAAQVTEQNFEDDDMPF